MKPEDPSRRTFKGTSSKRRDPAQKELYSRILDKVFDELLTENAALEEQRSSVPMLVSELLQVSASQRKLLVRNSCRYRAWPLAEELLARSEAGWADDPAESEALAAVALEICDHLPGEGFRARLLNDLKAEAWSYIGNCRRILSDLRGAQRAFKEAESFLARGSQDPMERARIQDLRASLLGAQRDFDGAVSLLSEAISQYRQVRDSHREGRALVNQAKLLSTRGRPEEAIPILNRAAGLVDEDREPRLKLALRNNLLYILTDVGRLEEAFQLIPEIRELARKHASRHDRLRVLWTEGRLRQRLGQEKLAEEALSQVREGFIAAGVGYDVAQVSLDLASLYLEAGRTADVRRLAVETMPLFASRNVQRELLMAWQLFMEAAERDAATVGLLKKVAARIRRSEGLAAGFESTP
jgi:tetratricopeptide (TPR) repeat protein